MSVMTRLDIENALRARARHSYSPTARNWKVFLQINAYVNATKDIGLRFVCGSRLRFLVFADADYTAALNYLRSLSIVAVMLGDTAISWKTSMRKCVTTSTCKAGYVALCDAAKEAILEKEILAYLQPQLAGMMCIDIFGDNEGSMAIANNPSSAPRSKHIDVKFNFIQGFVRAGETGSFM